MPQTEELLQGREVSARTWPQRMQHSPLYGRILSGLTWWLLGVTALVIGLTALEAYRSLTGMLPQFREQGSLPLYTRVAEASLLGGVEQRLMLVALALAVGCWITAAQPSRVDAQPTRWATLVLVIALLVETACLSSTLVYLLLVSPPPATASALNFVFEPNRLDQIGPPLASALLLLSLSLLLALILASGSRASAVAGNIRSQGREVTCSDSTLAAPGADASDSALPVRQIDRPPPSAT